MWSLNYNAVEGASPWLPIARVMIILVCWGHPPVQAFATPAHFTVIAPNTKVPLNLSFARFPGSSETSPVPYDNLACPGPCEATKRTANCLVGSECDLLVENRRTALGIKRAWSYDQARR